LEDYLIGKVIDGYKIESVLGKGGMGTVYKAKDTTLDRDVALKIMDSNLSRDENFLQRFQAEAKALAKLQNPHIVSIFALRETNVGLFIVMEFVDGGTLADKLKEDEPLDIQAIITMFKQMLDALEHAHQAGIVHRDIKPGNIMLSNNNMVKVTDFGLAKIQQQVSTATMTVGTGGTLFYMSPEQVRGLANVDSRGDIYSLGMTLYESLAGVTPFADVESDFDIRQSIVEGKIPPPDKFNASIPKSLSRVILKAIDKDREKRYQTAAEMSQALGNVDVSGLGSVSPQSAVKSSTSSGNRKILLPVAAISVAIILFAAWYFISGTDDTATTLSIATVPSESTVEINGTKSGITPLSKLSIAAGKTAIHVKRDGYRSRDTVIEIMDNTHSAIIITLSKLEKITDSEADVIPDNEIDNERSAASSTQDPSSSTAGREIREERPTATLGTLVLAAVPNASIIVDGKVIANNSSSAVRKKFSAGRYRIGFRHPQYGSRETTVTLTAGQTKSLTCYFEQFVNIGSNPVWGTIFVNGKNTGEYTPKDRLKLKPGKHSITVRRDGYTTKEGTRSIIVEPGFRKKVHTLVFTLNKQ
jgi:eukaryotic-like serine/threonine-protein kinase